MKKFMMVFAMFTVLVGFGAVSSSTAEARQDVWVADGAAGSVYIDADSSRLITQSSGKGVDNYYKIRADFYNTNGAGWSQTYEVMYSGNHIQVFENGRSIYPLRGIAGACFTSAWYYAMGYPFS